MKDDKYQTLLRHAKEGTISEKEIAAAAEELQKVSPEARRYTLLYIIGRSYAKSYRKLVESYLEYPEDPELSALALQILCGFWGDTPHYLDQVLRFIYGVDWDTSNECRLMAISVVGEYLRDREEKRFLKELIRIYEDEREDHHLREAAYLALARAMGRTYQEIPSAAHEFDLVNDIDPNVLKQARERISRNE